MPIATSFQISESKIELQNRIHHFEFCNCPIKADQFEEWMSEIVLFHLSSPDVHFCDGIVDNEPINSASDFWEGEPTEISTKRNYSRYDKWVSAQKSSTWSLQSRSWDHSIREIGIQQGNFCSWEIQQGEVDLLWKVLGCKMQSKNHYAGDLAIGTGKFLPRNRKLELMDSFLPSNPACSIRISIKDILQWEWQLLWKTWPLFTSIDSHLPSKEESERQEFSHRTPAISCEASESNCWPEDQKKRDTKKENQRFYRTVCSQSGGNQLEISQGDAIGLIWMRERSGYW